MKVQLSEDLVRDLKRLTELEHGVDGFSIRSSDPAAEPLWEEAREIRARIVPELLPVVQALGSAGLFTLALFAEDTDGFLHPNYASAGFDCKSVYDTGNIELRAGENHTFSLKADNTPEKIEARRLAQQAASQKREGSDESDRDTAAVSFHVLIQEARGFAIGVETDHDRFLEGPWPTLKEAQQNLSKLVTGALENGGFAIEKVSLRKPPPVE